MIGGIAPASTVDYYQRIISRFQERTGQRDYPSVIINSINLTHLMDLISNDQLERISRLLVRRNFCIGKGWRQSDFFGIEYAAPGLRTACSAGENQNGQHS